MYDVWKSNILNRERVMIYALPILVFILGLMFITSAFYTNKEHRDGQTLKVPVGEYILAFIFFTSSAFIFPSEIKEEIVIPLESSHDENSAGVPITIFTYVRNDQIKSVYTKSAEVYLSDNPNRLINITYICNIFGMQWFWDDKLIKGEIK